VKRFTSPVRSQTRVELIASKDDRVRTGVSSSDGCVQLGRGPGPRMRTRTGVSSSDGCVQLGRGPGGRVRMGVATVGTRRTGADWCGHRRDLGVATVGTGGWIGWTDGCQMGVRWVWPDGGVVGSGMSWVEGLHSGMSRSPVWGRVGPSSAARRAEQASSPDVTAIESSIQRFANRLRRGGEDRIRHHATVDFVGRCVPCR